MLWPLFYNEMESHVVGLLLGLPHLCQWHVPWLWFSSAGWRKVVCNCWLGEKDHDGHFLAYQLVCHCMVFFTVVDIAWGISSSSGNVLHELILTRGMCSLKDGVSEWFTACWLKSVIRLCLVKKSHSSMTGVQLIGHQELWTRDPLVNCPGWQVNSCSTWRYGSTICIN